MDPHVRRVVVADNVAGGRIPVTGEDCIGTLTSQVRREIARKLSSQGSTCDDALTPRNGDVEKSRRLKAELLPVVTKGAMDDSGRRAGDSGRHGRASHAVTGCSNNKVP